MLEIFRKNLFINSVLLLPYIFLVRLSSIIYPAAYLGFDVNNTAQSLIYHIIPGALIQNIVANALIFIHALLINHIFIRHRLSREITLLPGLIYVVLVSVVPDFMFLTPVLMANTFILFAVINLLRTYKTPNPAAYIFNSGVYLGVASLIYTPYSIIVLFGMIIILILRSFKLIEKLQYFTGFIIPYFILFAYKYWAGLVYVELAFIKDIFFRLPDIQKDDLIVFYISVGIISLDLLFVIFNYGVLTSKKSLQIQKKIDVFYWILLYSLISFLIFSTVGVIHLMTLAFPLAILTGILISDSKSHITHELIHFLVLTLIFLTQFKLLII
ncbi:MAG: hypothetical protein WBP08_16805 [Saprospiraceae bacterium]